MIETNQMIALPNPMTSTDVLDYSNLTSENYTQFLSESIVEKIDSYLEENFYIDDMIEFIQEYGDTAFCNHYDEYVEAGESNSYEAVDAFIEEFGVDYLGGFEDSYRGEWSSKRRLCRRLCKFLLLPRHSWFC